MATKNKIMNIAFLSTYPPRECGLATFTEDLVNEIDKIPYVRPSVIAVVNRDEYTNSHVEWKLSQHDRISYLLTALWANDNVDLLVIEHEYGIFGGECGEYIVDLAKKLKIPFIVTTHTVLLEPSPKQLAVLRELGNLSTKVVTMAESSIPLLAGTYGIESKKLVFIPHGVPEMHVRTVLANPVLKKEMEIKTLEVGQTMAWANVAARYVELCAHVFTETEVLPHMRMDLRLQSQPAAFPGRRNREAKAALV